MEERIVNELGHYTSINVLESIANSILKTDNNQYVVLRATDAFHTNDRDEIWEGYDYVMKILATIDNLAGDQIKAEYRLSGLFEDMKKSMRFKTYTTNQVKQWLLQEYSTPYVICFTSAIDRTKIWETGYGRNGKGICIVFDLTNVHRVQNGMFIHGPIKVVYNNSIGYANEKFLFEKVILKAYNDYYHDVSFITELDEIIEKKVQAVDQFCSLISSFIKNEEWSHEEEFRIAAIRHNYPTSEKCSIRKKEDGMAYVELKIPLSCLKKIIIGPRVDNNEVEKIMSAARSLGLLPKSVVKSKSPLK